jgi:hypothetical protein
MCAKTHLKFLRDEFRCQTFLEDMHDIDPLGLRWQKQLRGARERQRGECFFAFQVSSGSRGLHAAVVHQIFELPIQLGLFRGVLSRQHFMAVNDVDTVGFQCQMSLSGNIIRGVIVVDSDSSQNWRTLEWSVVEMELLSRDWSKLGHDPVLGRVFSGGTDARDAAKFEGRFRITKTFLIYEELHRRSLQEGIESIDG